MVLIYKHTVKVMNRTGIIFNNTPDSTKDVLFPSSKAPLGRKELTEVVSFELVNKKTDKIYDSVESDEVLFGEEFDSLIDEEEYTIISDCEDGGIHENNLPNGEAFVAIVLQNAKEKPYRKEKRKKNTKRIRNGIHETNGPKPSHFNGVNSTYTKTSGSKSNNEKLLSNANNENDANDHFENTSAPMQDYEMNIIASPNSIRVLGPSNKKKEFDKGLANSQEERKSSFRNLSNRIMKSFEDLSVQDNKPMESFNCIPLEELRDIDNECTTDDSIITHIRILRKQQPISTHVGNLKSTSPVSENVMCSLKCVSLNKNTADKCMKRSISDITPKRSFDLQMTPLDNDKTAASRRRHNGLRKKVKDDFFFETTNTLYGELESQFYLKPIELEMKTFPKRDNITNGDIDKPLPKNECLSPRTSVEIVRGREVTSRYISIYKEERCTCRFITVVFCNVNQSTVIYNKLDVPCEEVIEQIYTHLIEEVIIYEDEFSDSSEDSYEEWLIVK